MRVCRVCNELREHKGRGLCRACYQRMERQGRLDEFPRVPKSGRKPDPREHGTVKGWYQHYRRKEDACQPCLEALRDHARERRLDPKVMEYQRDYQRLWQRARSAGHVGRSRCGVCGRRLALHSLSDDCFRRAA